MARALSLTTSCRELARNMSRRRLTESIAAGLRVTGAGPVLHALANTFQGGYVLAFHSAPARTMVDLVEALHPDRVVSLDEIVQRLAAGKSTSGLFAITVDDGYQGTVIDYCAAARGKGWPMTFFLPTRYLEERTLPFLLVQNLEARLPSVVLELPSGSIDLRTETARQAYFGRLTQQMYQRREAEFMPEVEAIATHAIALGLLTDDEVRDAPAPISWDQVETLARQDGISFQSHGVTHQAVVSLDADELRNELRASQAAIRARTDRPVNHFCYPYGGTASIGTAAPAIVAETFEAAVTMSRGRLRGSTLYALPRIPLYDRDRGDIARLKVLTAASYRNP